MYNHILIRYGELSLKKSNRNQFIKTITTHIKNALKKYEQLSFESRGMRFYIILNGENPENIILVLKNIPGLYSFSLVARCESVLDDIKQLAVKVLQEEDLENKTIKVETNRANKQFTLSSLEISKEVSRELFRTIPNLKANVHNPDITVNVDVRDEGTFIFTKIYYGMNCFYIHSFFDCFNS